MGLISLTQFLHLNCFYSAYRVFILSERSSVEEYITVEPYSIHGSFSKLKTEFNEDSGTCAIAKVTYHSYRIMVNLSINHYFKVMRHP